MKESGNHNLPQDLFFLRYSLIPLKNLILFQFFIIHYSQESAQQKITPYNGPKKKQEFEKGVKDLEKAHSLSSDEPTTIFYAFESWILNPM